MRLFYALDIDPDTRAALASAAAPLRGISGLRLVDPELYHVTLMFFGNATAEQFSILKDFTPPIMSLEFKVDRFGAFPSGKFPQSVWAGLACDRAMLEEIRNGCGSAAKRCGLTVDGRPYLPHITVARYKQRGSVDPRLVSFLAGVQKKELFTSRFISITLYGSELTPRGPVYTPLVRKFPEGE